MITEGLSRSDSSSASGEQVLPLLPASQSYLSVIVPTRNEADNIEPLLQRLQRALKTTPFEVIFVDDSSDNTAKVIGEVSKQFPFKVTVIARPPERRNGLGKAVVEGMQAARSEWLVVMDGDLQHPPEVIPELLDRAHASAADLVVASRLTEGGSTAGLSQARALLSRSLALGIRICFPKNLRNISDPLTGFFLLRRERVSTNQLQPEGFKILLEILIRNPKLVLAEVPFEFGKRHSGSSKANPDEMFRLFKQTLKLRLTTMKQLIQFLTVGGIGVIVNQVLFYLFNELLGINYLLAAVLATQGSTGSNFLGIEGWVFRGRSQTLSLRQRFISFWIMNNFIMLVTRGPLLALLVSGLGMRPLAANLLTLVAMVAVRYMIADAVIWSARAERKTHYYYNIHNIIRIRSAQYLPELNYFKTDEVLKEIDYDVIIDSNPASHRTATSITYDEILGRLGFSIVVNRTETPIKVYVSPLVGLSPHVLYTNVMEPLLRWSFAHKGYALMHGACVAFDGQALFITAQTDTGKTTTILQVIRDQREKCLFLSDDMTIFSKEGKVLNYPKPMTISNHTLRAVNRSALTFRERLFLDVQSRLHSREGRHVGMWLSHGKIPAATLNAIVQAIIPPPKYMVNRLIPGAQITDTAQLARIVVIERGPSFERELTNQDKVKILMANAEDAYGFPPYPSLAKILSTWDGQDLHLAEQQIVEAVTSQLPAIHLRSSNYDWYQRLPGLANQSKTASETPIPVPSAIPVSSAIPAPTLKEMYLSTYVSKDPSVNS